MAYDLIKISGLPLVTPDSGQDIVVGVGDYAKRINYNAVKADMVGTSPSYTTDTEPYLMRQTAHTGVVGKCALEKLVGGSLGWNQLIQKTGTGWYVYRGTVAYDSTANEFTCTFNGEGIGGLYSTSVASGIPQGHKVLMCATIKASKSIGFRLYCNNASKNFTASTSYAFYAAVLNTGAANEIDFYLTSAPTSGDIMYVKNAQLIDLTVEFGSTIADYIYSLESATAGAGVAWLSKYIDLGTYHAYDAGSIQSVQATAHVTKDANANVIGNYPLGSDTLRGVPQLVSNKLSYDGDEKYPDGTIKRKYGIANIDDLTFTYDSTNKWLMGSSALPNSISSTTAMPNSMTDMPYDAVAANTLNVNTKAWTLYTGKVVVKDSSLTEAQLRAAISGKHIVYPLATPTTESSTAFQKVQTIDADGTESFTTSSPVPVGHETQTPDNILAALEWLGE